MPRGPQAAPPPTGAGDATRSPDDAIRRQVQRLVAESVVRRWPLATPPRPRPNVAGGAR